MIRCPVKVLTTLVPKLICLRCGPECHLLIYRGAHHIGIVERCEWTPCLETVAVVKTHALCSIENNTSDFIQIHALWLFFRNSCINQNTPELHCRLLALQPTLFGKFYSCKTTCCLQPKQHNKIRDFGQATSYRDLNTLVLKEFQNNL